MFSRLHFFIPSDRKRRRLSCCPLEQSVFIGGEGGEEDGLSGITSQRIKDVLLTLTQTKDFHVLKAKSNPYGHVHFKTENDAGIFINVSRNNYFLDSIMLP